MADTFQITIAPFADFGVADASFAPLLRPTVHRNSPLGGAPRAFNFSR